jgi:hypothetical protein
MGSRVRHLYVPMEHIREGMVLGDSIQVSHHGYLSLTLPAGHALTDENIEQLGIHHAEFIPIDQKDQRSDEGVAVDVAQAVGRVLSIFEGVDLTDPAMAAFFDQVLAYRSA